MKFKTVGRMGVNGIHFPPSSHTEYLVYYKYLGGAGAPFDRLTAAELGNGSTSDSMVPGGGEGSDKARLFHLLHMRGTRTRGGVEFSTWSA